jgi:RNA polymerase sigma-70 factor (ECF subfamily)
VARLATILSEDVDLRADSNGKVVAVRRVLSGVEAVSAFVAQTLSQAWAGAEIETEIGNGQQVLAVGDRTGLSALVSFGYGPDGLVKHIFIQRNPEKLRVYQQRRATLAGRGGLVLS